MNTNHTLFDVQVIDASIDFGSNNDGCVAVCYSSGQEYILEKNFGPCGVYIEHGHVRFGDPVSLPSLDMRNDISIVFDQDGHFLLWTLKRWYDKVKDQIIQSRDRQHVKVQKDKQRQESSRKRGIYQRLIVLKGGCDSGESPEDVRFELPDTIQRVHQDAGAFGTPLKLAWPEGNLG